MIGLKDTLLIRWVALFFNVFIFFLFFRFVVVAVQIIVCLYFCLLISADIL